MRKALLIFSLIILTACSNQTAPETTEANEGEPLKIVTSFAPIYSFTSNIALDDADIHNLVPVGTSVHSYQLKPSDLKKISEADLLIINGLELEEFLKDTIESSGNEDLIVVDTSEGINVLEFPEESEEEHHEEDEHEDHDEHSDHEEDHHEDEHEDEHDEEEGHHHHHDGSDPHVWLSLDNAIQQSAAIKNALQDIDPDNKELYEKNFKTYSTNLMSLKSELTAELSEVEPQNFIVFHDAYQYFLESFNLNSYQVGAIQEFPGKQTSPREFQELVELIQDGEVHTIFTEPQFEPKTVESLKEQVPALKSAELDPIGAEISKESYEKLLRANVQNIINAFTK